MKAKFAGLALATALSLAARADTYHFTPIIDTNDAPGNALALQLGDQLTLNVTPGSDNHALFTFSNDGNGGSLSSVLTRIYLDDSPSGLFANIGIAGDSGSSVAFHAANPTPLPGGNIPTFAFGTTSAFVADPATALKGIHNGSARPGEFLTLSALLNAGRSFADVINSLNAGSEVDKNFLRVGLRVTSIDNLDLAGQGMSYLDANPGGASPPPPVPEPETYGLLLAGLGFVAAAVRRRRRPAGPRRETPEPAAGKPPRKAGTMGLALLASALSLAAHAETYHFTPITAPDNVTLQNLSSQLLMEVAPGSAGDVLFTFTNNGAIESSLSRIYFDDVPANLFSNLTVAAQTPGVDFGSPADPPNLAGGDASPYLFFASNSAGTLSPHFNNGVNNSAEVPGEFLTLSAVLNSGKAFADVIDSLNGGGITNRDFLRVGLRVIGIDRFNDSGSASFLDISNASPVPIPESSTYGMLLAGLGLITAIARRRQAQ